MICARCAESGASYGYAAGTDSLKRPPKLRSRGMVRCWSLTRTALVSHECTFHCRSIVVLVSLKFKILNFPFIAVFGAPLNPCQRYVKCKMQEVTHRTCLAKGAMKTHNLHILTQQLRYVWIRACCQLLMTLALAAICCNQLNRALFFPGRPE